MKDYKNNEYIPLLEPLQLVDDQETPVWLLVPFPLLHTALLGPVNDAKDSLVEYYDIEWLGLMKKQKTLY